MVERYRHDCFTIVRQGLSVGCSAGQRGIIVRSVSSHLSDRLQSRLGCADRRSVEMEHDTAFGGERDVLIILHVIVI